jgi:uncharacterized DUF497 family protein
LRFEWDGEKSESNRKKHGVWFEQAQTVFEDPRSLLFFDEVHSENEERFVMMGLSERLNVLVVVFCERDNGIRIISARKATIMERRAYEKGIRP